MFNNNCYLIETDVPTLSFASPNESSKKQYHTNPPEPFANNSIDYVVLNSLKQYLDENQNASVFAEIVSTYLIETKERLDQLEKAVKSLDIKGIKLIAHNLKGISSTLGVVKLASFCVELENLTPESLPTEANNIFVKIQKEFKQVYKIFSLINFIVCE